MIERIRQVLGIAYVESRWVRRQPLWVLQGVIGTVGFIMIIFAWGSVEALRNLAVAYVVVGAWGQGLNIVAQDIGWSRIGREFERLVASPVTLPIYFTGIVVGTSPFLIVDVVPAVLLAIIVGMDFLKFMALFLLAPIALILGAFLSLSIILRIKNPTNISAITNPLYTITTILPPVYYPLRLLPPNLRIAALAIPTASLVEAGRWIVGYDPSCDPLYPLTILLGWLIVLVFLVARRLRWGLE